MPHVLVVTEDPSWAGPVARCLEPLDVSFFCLDGAAALGPTAAELDIVLVVLDGSLEQALLHRLATALRARAEVVVLHPTEPVQTSLGQWVWMQWPRDQSKLLSLVQRRLSTSLPPPAFNVTEYIQLACMARRSVRIACSTSRATGFILVSDGDVWDAGATSASGRSQLVGEEALRFWVTEEGVWIRVHALRTPPIARVILAHWEHLLLETMQLRDEGALDTEWPSQSEPTPVLVKNPTETPPVRNTRSTAPPPSSTTYPERARVLVNQAIRAITEGNYDQAVLSLEQALQLAPNDKLVEHRLRKLRQVIEQRND